MATTGVQQQGEKGVEGARLDDRSESFAHNGL